MKTVIQVLKDGTRIVKNGNFIPHNLYYEITYTGNYGLSNLNDVIIYDNATNDVIIYDNATSDGSISEISEEDIKGVSNKKDKK